MPSYTFQNYQQDVLRNNPYQIDDKINQSANAKVDNLTCALNKTEKKDTFIKAQNGTNEQKVGFKEGALLVGKGFLNKAKNIAKAIVKHPIKTLTTAILTTLALSALPLIGVSSAVGASILTLGCAGIAITKTTSNIIKAIKHNKKGEYSAMRDNLQKVGESSLDLALSLPFAPKAVKNVKDFAKYGKVSLNSGLINDIKNAKRFSEKFKIFKNANNKITEEINFNKTINKICKNADDIAQFQEMRKLPNEEFVIKAYQKMIKDMGIEDFAPEINLDGLPAKGGFFQDDCCITISEDYCKIMKKHELIQTLRHELEHFKQYSDIARYKGTDWIAELSAKRYMQNCESIMLKTEKIENDIEFLKKHGEKAFIEKIVKELKENNEVNYEAYEKVIKKLGKIEKGTKEAIEAEKYVQGAMEYPDLCNGYDSHIAEKYLSNYLEVNARKAGAKPEGAMGQYREASLQTDEMIIKDTFARDVITSNVRTNALNN